MLKSRRFFIISATITVVVLAALASLAHGNDHGKVSSTISGAKVSIEYNRPLLKGRGIMKMLHPGQLWRIGADDPTTLETDKDLDFGGTRVPKGKHILLARMIEGASGPWAFRPSRSSNTNPARKCRKTRSKRRTKRTAWRNWHSAPRTRAGAVGSTLRG